MDLSELFALQNIFCHSDITKNEEFAIMNLFIHNLKLSKTSLDTIKSQMQSVEKPASQLDQRSDTAEPYYQLILPLLKLQKSPRNSDEMNKCIQQHVLKIVHNLLYIFN
jgi:hypothetical protein